MAGVFGVIVRPAVDIETVKTFLAGVPSDPLIHSRCRHYPAIDTDTTDVLEPITSPTQKHRSDPLGYPATHPALAPWSPLMTIGR